MTEYVTTNIRLPKDLHRRLKRRALDEDKSLSQLIRESVARYLTDASVTLERDDKQQLLITWQNDPLWGIGGDEVVADVGDGSVNHDQHLYGSLSASARVETGDK